MNAHKGAPSTHNLGTRTTPWNGAKAITTSVMLMVDSVLRTEVRSKVKPLTGAMHLNVWIPCHRRNDAKDAFKPTCLAVRMVVHVWMNVTMSTIPFDRRAHIREVVNTTDRRSMTVRVHRHLYWY